MSKKSSNEPQTDLAKEKLALIDKCLVCTKKYGNQPLNIIEKDDMGRLMYITCSHCEHAMLILVGMTGTGVLVLGSITDLSLNDVRFLQSKGSITEDELLEGVNLINNQSQELIKFLTKS